MHDKADLIWSGPLRDELRNALGEVVLPQLAQFLQSGNPSGGAFRLEPESYRVEYYGLSSQVILSLLFCLLG